MEISTIYGLMDESLLTKKTGGNDTQNEMSDWVEYYLKGELVHRSANVLLKNVTGVASVGDFNG